MFLEVHLKDSQSNPLWGAVGWGCPQCGKKVLVTNGTAPDVTWKVEGIKFICEQCHYEFSSPHPLCPVCDKSLVYTAKNRPGVLKHKICMHMVDQLIDSGVPISIYLHNGKARDLPQPPEPLAGSAIANEDNMSEVVAEQDQITRENEDEDM